jgi:mono/diheme cytochrome c family protein
MLLTSLSACDNRGEMPASGFVLEEDVADSYLSFINPQQTFSSSIYQLLILPDIAIEGTLENTTSNTGYSAVIINTSSDSGINSLDEQTEQQKFEGVWSETSDLDWNTNSANSHDLDLTSNQNITINIQCTHACQLYIVKAGYRYQQIESDEKLSIQFKIADSLINSVAYAEQYYRAVDPDNERTTLDAWKTKNGFDQGHDVHVIFRDTKDLGYGRDMYARRNNDGSLAFYVNNFVVAVGEGNPANYGPLNLLAATDQNFDYHLGSNAIEFSAIDPSDPDSEKILKFFTFSADDNQNIQPRITSADLDGRGIKHMPSICLACHGGNLLPLNQDGSFNELSLKSAKLNQLELDSFEFMATGEFSEENQQVGIKIINQWVRDSYAEMGQREQSQKGFWDSEFSQNIANARYGSDSFSLAQYQTGTVPSGWQQTEFRPEGVENLYLQVVEPHCISCHSLRGYQAGDDSLVDDVIINDQEIKLGNAINFSSYEKFISYSEIITDYVYRRGIMPLSLRNAEVFWQAPYSAPALLASFLPSFSQDIDVLSEQGEIQPPGLPTSRLEAERLSALPLTLHGGSSSFAKDYQWSIISGPEGHDAQLENVDKKITRMVGTTEGEYQLALTVNNSRGESSKQMTVQVDSSHKPEHEINFVDDIKPLLQNQLYDSRSCQSCHNSTTGVEGISVFYDVSNMNLYSDVRERVNFRSPLDSLLLMKPTRYQHGGGIRFDLDTRLGLESYNTILQWIIAGAPCGTDALICP